MIPVLAGMDNYETTIVSICVFLCVCVICASFGRHEK